MIEEIIESICNKTAPSDGDNLLGFKIDCDGLLLNECYDSIIITETNKNNNLIDIEITLNNKIDSIQNLTTLIRKDYQNIEYQYFSAHGVEWNPNQLIFRFVTVITNNIFYVTGTIRVKGEYYKKLFIKNEELFKI